jgi:hypothetical protein
MTTKSDRFIIRVRRGFILCGLFALAARLSGDPAEQSLRRDFVDPPLQWHSRPLWFWNGKLAAEKTRAMIAACREAGYGGLGILPTCDMGAVFMSPEFLEQYKAAVDAAAELGMKLCLYDEFWFPSGSAGGLLAQKHPEALGKRLDLLSVDVRGPTAIEQAAPAGTLMSAVAMNRGTKERRNITSAVKDGKLVWSAPAGEWQVMLFTCVRDGGAGLVDYLNPDAVRRFVELTYESYHGKFPGSFGAAVDSAFYDEPAMYHVQGGRAWTDSFNERFRERFGSDPAVLYPALWFDIGPDTASARNALFGMRAELYSTGFPKTINEWCRAHGIQLTGHVDQEELVNPVIGQAGDLIKAFKHQDMPGIDQIGHYGRASRAYKVVSSAAYNYDRPLVMTECYGAINNMPVANLYKEAMDQFAKGINVMVPHAVWYASPKVHFPPDLTPGAATYGAELPEYNRYIGRLQRMLQSGRHVADIGVLYPIATLQAGSWFGPGNPYEGCVSVPEADYMNVGEILSLQVRRDYTFVHPEVLEENCRVEGAQIHLNNQVNAERYKVFILPGSRAIEWSALKKIKAFYENGGAVIATTQLPDRSAEFGKDREVREAVAAMFGAPAGAPRVTASSTWAAGGYEAGRAADGDEESRWNAADGDPNPQWLELDLGAARTVGRTVVREAFDRTRAYRIQAWNGAIWKDVARGERLGDSRTDTFMPVATSKVRLCIDSIVSDSASVREFMVLDPDGRNLVTPAGLCARTNACGGRAYFVPSPQPAALKAALDDALDVYDVEFEQLPPTPGGNFSYIHKVVENRDIFFVGNSSEAAVDTWMRIRGRHRLECWDPHTGGIGPCEETVIPGTDGEVTRVRVKLAPVRSVFFVEEGTDQ